MARRPYSGITQPIFTIALLIVFFFGLIYLSWHRVSGLGEGSNSGGSQVAAAMKKVEQLVSGAVRLNAALPQAGSEAFGCNHTRLDFLEDLDGDPNTGSFSLGGKRGLERVLLERPSAEGTELVVKVFERPGSAPETTVLFDDLLRKDARAFYLQYLANGGSNAEVPGSAAQSGPLPRSVLDRTGAVRVRITGRSTQGNQGQATTAIRKITLKSPANP